MKSKVNELSIKCYVYARHLLPFLIVGFVISCIMSSTSFAAAGVNRLEGLRGDVVATFGAGSDMQYYLLLAEGIAGAYAYTKTKNIAVLAGVPVLMVFTHYALKG